MLPQSKRNYDDIILDLCNNEKNISEKILNGFGINSQPDFLVYPIVILCDDLKSTDKIFTALESRKNIFKDRKKIIIVKNKNGIKPDVLWKIIAQDIYDIVDWNSEDDVLNYIRSLKERSDKINLILNSPLVKKSLVGESKAWNFFLYQIVEAALFTKSPILLIGESGTGKELISRLIHTVDARLGKKDLVLLDCTTITPELSGSEFFGHEKGSYTNAIQSREGAFSLANNGTLFLDEVGELPPRLQSELLRVIQEGTFKKIGSNNWQKTNFRLICATNKNIRNVSSNGSFRHDLYFRISDFEFKVPSLNERKEDIPLLADYFLKEFYNAENTPELDNMVTEYLMNREYPGNVRDLKQLIRRIALKHLDHKKITIGEIPVQDRPVDCLVKTPQKEFVGTLREAILSGHTLRDLKNQTMDEAIKVTLEICNGDKTMAARKLGVTLRAFQQFWKKNRGG